MKKKKLFVIVGIIAVLGIAVSYLFLFNGLSGLVSLKEANESEPSEPTQTSAGQKIQIQNAEASVGSISLKLSAEKPAEVTSVQITNREGEILCGKNISLQKGEHLYEFNCSKIKREISVVVLPEGSKSVEKDFNLELPTLELQKGMVYSYLAPNNQTIDVFVTGESDSVWTGIIATVVNDSVAFNKFELDKEVLTLKTSNILKKEEVNQDTQLQPAFLGVSHPFGMLAFQQQFGVSVPQIVEKGKVELTASGQQGTQKVGEIELMEKGTQREYEAYGFEYNTQMQTQDGNTQQVTLNFWTATEKPYLLINLESQTNLYSLNKVEEKEFSLDEFAEFKSYEPPKALMELVGQEILTNGQVNMALKNNYSQPIHLKYFKIGEQKLDANIALPPQETKVIPLQLGIQAEAGQQYQFPIVTGVQIEDQTTELDIMLSGEVKEPQQTQ